MKTKCMFKPTQVVMTAAVAMAMAVPLYAAPDMPTPDASSPAFQKLDTNHDGYISRDEAPKLRSFDTAFAEADANHDGKLDADEFAKAQAINDRIRGKAVVTDSSITAKVKAALVKTHDVPGFKVNVKTTAGVVLLSGFVENEQQALRAEEIAASVKGVRSVKSNLVVKS
jgi:hyperosmotically inducible protein